MTNPIYATITASEWMNSPEALPVWMPTGTGAKEVVSVSRDTRYGGSQEFFVIALTRDGFDDIEYDYLGTAVLFTDKADAERVLTDIRSMYPALAR